jgi:hypothetical protein
MQQFFSLLSWRLFTAQYVSGVFLPIIRSSMIAVAASDFTFVSWWQSCCFRGRAGRPAGPTTNTARLTTHIIQFQLIQETSRQLLGWILPDTVNTVKYSWWWAKNRTKHVELTRNNRLTCIVAPCWLLSQLYYDSRIHERQKNFILTDGSPRANDMLPSAAPVWIWDLAFVLSWKSSSFSALWSTAVDSVHNLLQNSRKYNGFLIWSKILSRIFLILQAFILRLSNELPWRDIPETSNTFIHFFSLLQFYFHFFSIPRSLLLSSTAE